MLPAPPPRFDVDCRPPHYISSELQFVCRRYRRHRPPPSAPSTTHGVPLSSIFRDQLLPWSKLLDRHLAFRNGPQGSGRTQKLSQTSSLPRATPAADCGLILTRPHVYPSPHCSALHVYSLRCLQIGLRHLLPRSVLEDPILKTSVAPS
jgi:hypothetical protein